jgi:radical SAM superfamily enzyme YgiQ (UPF0313 family)
MAALESAGADCDMRLGATTRECADQVAASTAGAILVLWSFYSPDADAMAAELAAVRAATPEQAAPRVLHIAGGVHATAEPQHTLDSGWDLCAIGEGESTILALVEALRDGGELTGLGARIHAHTFMPLPGTPWRDASPAFIPLPTMRELDQLALRGSSYGHWRKQAGHSARLAETARAYPRRAPRRRTTGP